MINDFLIDIVLRRLFPKAFEICPTTLIPFTIAFPTLLMLRFEFAVGRFVVTVARVVTTVFNVVRTVGNRTSPSACSICKSSCFRGKAFRKLNEKRISNKKEILILNHIDRCNVTFEDMRSIEGTHDASRQIQFEHTTDYSSVHLDYTTEITTTFLKEISSH